MDRRVGRYVFRSVNHDGPEIHDVHLDNDRVARVQLRRGRLSLLAGAGRALINEDSGVLGWNEFNDDEARRRLLEIATRMLDLYLSRLP